MANIVHATQATQVAAVRALFAEYARAVDAPRCFVGLERELASLPGEYAPPAGRLFLALDASGSAGCVALRPLDADAAEMKRPYGRPARRAQERPSLQRCARPASRRPLPALPAGTRRSAAPAYRPRTTLPRRPSTARR